MKRSDLLVGLDEQAWDHGGHSSSSVTGNQF